MDKIISTISIREFKFGDKESILELFNLNTPKYFSCEEEKELENYLKNEIEYYYVATFKDQIIGCGGINFKDKQNIGFISWDIIHPEYQGKGIGKLILKHRIEKLLSFKTTKHIRVRTSQHAFKFYEKNGFILLEIIENYWANGFHLYNMQYSPK